MRRMLIHTTVLAAWAALASCRADIAAPSSAAQPNASEPSTNRVTGGDAVSYDYFFGDGTVVHGPDVAAAPNGDRIELAGQGELSLHPKSVSGGGTFVHKNASGSVLGSGTWTADALLSFNSYGSSPGLPPELEGGLAVIRIHLSPASGGAGFDATLQADCLLGAPPPSAREGIRVAVQGGPNFNNEVSGETVYIRQ